MNRADRKSGCRRGAALLVVLFIVMAITLISFGFIAKSDMELACAANVPLRMQMDYLAQSGLEHAKVLMINPQEVDTDAQGYWLGATGLQVASGDDYYDLAIVQSSIGDTAVCTFDIECSAYTLTDGERTAVSELNATLRLDPFIAYWQDGNNSLPGMMVVNGDVYCDDNIQINGDVNGDVLARGSISVTGDVTGSEDEAAADPIGAAGLTVDMFNWQYYYDGGGPYNAKEIWNTNISSLPDPGLNNPAKLYYRNADLEFDNCTIILNGTLVVKNHLTLINTCDINIAPVKNMPALLVGGDLHFDDPNQRLITQGLVQTKGFIEMHGNAGIVFSVDGALQVLGEGFKNVSSDADITITGDPVKGAVKIWTDASSSWMWSPAGGAFFKSVSRPAP